MGMGIVVCDRRETWLVDKTTKVRTGEPPSGEPPSGEPPPGELYGESAYEPSSELLGITTERVVPAPIQDSIE